MAPYGPEWAPQAFLASVCLTANDDLRATQNSALGDTSLGEVVSLSSLTGCSPSVRPVSEQSCSSQSWEPYSGGSLARVIRTLRISDLI